MITAFHEDSSDLPSFIRPFLISMFVGVIIVVLQLLVLLATIRRNLLQAFRGDTTEIPRRNVKDSIGYAIGNFHFAGYFIGYTFWGLLLIVFWLFIILLVLDLIITFQGIRFVHAALKYIIPALLFYLFKSYVNKTLAHLVFLQDAQQSLAIDNRRVLMIFLYFNFFLDAFLGLISSVIRLLQSLIAGILYMCRLDYSPLGRKLETFDAGFTAYCGFIHSECAQRHPIMLLFVAHLLNSSSKQLISIEHDHISEKDKIRRKHIRRKWQLASFLVRNPSIVFFRKTYLRIHEPRN